MPSLEGVRNFQKSIAEDVYPDGWKGNCTVCGKPFSYTKEECAYYLGHGWPKCDHINPPVEKVDRRYDRVTKDTDYSESVVTGRNGTYNIKQVQLSPHHYGRGDDMVFIDAIGKRDTVLNAGFYITLDCFKAIAKEFLENSGYTVEFKGDKNES